MERTTTRGRKNCSRCTRWRPVTDFSPRKWEGGVIRKLHSRCRSCVNEERREKYTEDPRWRAYLREAHREHEATKRRERGVPERPMGKHNKGNYGAGRVGPVPEPVDYDTEQRRKKWAEEQKRYRAREILIQD